MSVPAEPRTSASTKPPLPTGLLIATILVVLQALVRITLLASLLIRNPGFLGDPVVLVQSVIIPSLLLLLTVVMVVLVFARARAARVYGIVVCILLLVFQVYVFSRFTLPFFTALPFPTATLSITYFIVFAVELFFLATWSEPLQSLQAYPAGAKTINTTKSEGGAFGTADPSSGCRTLNGHFDRYEGLVGNAAGTGFNAGDKIVGNVSGPGLINLTSNAGPVVPFVKEFVYVIPSTNNDTYSVAFLPRGPDPFYEWRCIPVTEFAMSTNLNDAAFRGDLIAVQALLAKEAGVNTKTSDGLTALMLASQEGHSDVVQALLVKEADINAKVSNGATALMLACQNGHSDVVQALIAKGAEVSARRPNDGVTALIIASYKGHLDVVQALIAEGAEVSGRRPNDGVTALIIASYKGHLDVVQALLAKGAKVNAKRTSDGSTALMVASQEGHLDVVQALLAKGAEVNAKTNDGSTALYAASQNGHHDIVQALLAKGAEVNAGSHRALLLLSFRQFHPNPYAVELLNEQSCYWNEAHVPLSERGVRFSWLCNFVKSICWQQNELLLEQVALPYHRNLPASSAYSGHDGYIQPDNFCEATIHELVAEHIVPLTKAIRAPLYALVPPSDRGKPEVFLSHAWANPVLSAYASMVPSGTFDAFDSKWPGRVKEEFVWIDFVCYNQHTLASETIAFDIEALIRSIGNLAFALTVTPLFDRIWCLWELLSASQTGAKVRFCAPVGYRTDLAMMVRRFFETVKSMKEAKATKQDDYEKLLAAAISRFGSVATADEHIRKLMREEMDHR